MMQRKGGFSLVEIAVALGLVAFVLLALIGLMSVGLEAGRTSHLDTVQALIVGGVMTELALEDFDAIPAAQTRFFDYGGRLLSGATDAFFRCEVAVENVTTGPDSLMAHPGIDQHLARVEIRISQPVGATAPEITVYHASVAR